MKYKHIKCAGYEDLKELIIDVYFKPLKEKVRRKLITSWNYNEQWVKLDDMAKEEWAKLLRSQKNRKYFERDGFIIITYKNKKYIRVPFAEGHPLQSEKAEKKVTVRLTDKEYKRLNSICKTGTINKSEVMRFALNKYLSETPNIKDIKLDLKFTKERYVPQK